MRIPSCVGIEVLLISTAPVHAQDAQPWSLEGIWRVAVSAEGDAKEIFGGELDGAVFLFQKGDLIVATRNSKIHKGPYKAATSKNEMFSIDFTWNEKTVHGLGILKDSSITLAFDRSGAPRPAGLLLDKPALALLRLEKQTDTKPSSALSANELKWIRSAADDFLIAFVKRDQSTYYQLVRCQPSIEG
jgi:hypothetical protein